VPSDACNRCDRRQFLAQASVLGVGALIVGCGDGNIGGPENVTDFSFSPVSVDGTTIVPLRDVGGRAVVRLPNDVVVLIERQSSTRYRGFVLACPHRGTTLAVYADRFECPNHGARFSRDGVWLGGQPTSDMVPIGVVAQSGGALLVGGVPVPPKPPAIVLAERTLSFQSDTGSGASFTRRLAVTNSGDDVLTALRVEVRQDPAQSSSWLTATLDAANAPTMLNVACRPGVLPSGSYTAQLIVSAANALAQTVNATLIVRDVEAAPSLGLSISTLALQSVLGASPPPQPIAVLNSGGGVINGLTIAVEYTRGGGRWLEDSRLQGTSTPATLTLRPDTGALAIGEYAALVHVRGTGIPSRSVLVTLLVDVDGIRVRLDAWPSLATVGGVAGSVGELNGMPVAISRVSATAYAAFSMVCPHAGTTIQVLDGASFRCPNHGALFDSSGQLRANSPQRTSALISLNVRREPGGLELVVW